MKKGLLVLLVTCMFGFINAQEREDFAHLNLGIRGGMNLMRDYGYSVGATERLNFVAGGNLEYTFNPLWGIGLDYAYLSYNQDYKNVDHPHIQPGSKVTAAVNDVALYVSINVSNLLAQYRCKEWQPFNAYAHVGSGFGFYSYDNTVSGEKGNNKTLILPVGVNLEYNFNDWFAMNLGAEYRWHQANDMKMDKRTTTLSGGNDFLLGALGFRFKFISDKRHVRNLSYTAFQHIRSSEAGITEYAELKKETTILKTKLAEQISENEALQNYVREMGDVVKDLDRRLNRFMGNTSSVADRNTEAIAAIKRSQEAVAKDAFSSLEFETGSSVIKSNSYKGLDRLAEALRTNPDWIIRLSGYTDSSGSVAKNVQLSQDRADSVKLYLERKGIAGNRIIAVGYGPENPIASNNTAAGRAQNRRVEIQIE